MLRTWSGEQTCCDPVSLPRRRQMNWDSGKSEVKQMQLSPLTMGDKFQDPQWMPEKKKDPKTDANQIYTCDKV